MLELTFGGSSTEVTFVVGRPSGSVVRYRSWTAVIGSEIPRKWSETTRVARTVPGAICDSGTEPVYW